ncbi:class I histocompatibility antigen, F10 alpha chain-like [Porphyrio hochstetteri]
MVILERWLDLMISVVFSNCKDPMKWVLQVWKVIQCEILPWCGGWGFCLPPRGFRRFRFCQSAETGSARRPVTSDASRAAIGGRVAVQPIAGLGAGLAQCLIRNGAPPAPVVADAEPSDGAEPAAEPTAKAHHVDAHEPKSRATGEHQNNQQVDQAAKIEVAQVDLDWQSSHGGRGGACSSLSQSQAHSAHDIGDLERRGELGLGWVLGLLLLGVLGWAACKLHSLCYFHTAVSEPSPGVPQFVSLGYVDGNLISRYDSEKGRTVPRADWMAANLDQQHWDQQTQIEQTNQEIYTVNLDTLQSRYNQSGGAHTFQSMVSCDLLEDNITRGYWQIANDGRDFIAFDMDTMTFTAADAAAQITKRNWEADRTVTEHMKHYLENTSPEWLRKYVSYGQAVLERKEPPMVRVLKKETQGILTLHCHAYGFYPRPISISWLKDGEVRDQETERGSIVPNSDGTYYTWVSIEAPPGEQDKYQCRVEHASLAEPGVFVWEPESNPLTIVLGVVVPLAILAVVAITGFIIWKRRSASTRWQLPDVSPL